MKKKTSNSTKLIVRNPDTVDNIQNNDLVQISQKLLDRMISSTGMLSIKEMTPNKAKEAKLVLGYLNVTNNVIKTKMQFFKMVGLDGKIKAVKNVSKKWR